MRIYLIRHGETELNKQGCYYGVTDAALTDHGRDQAAMLGQFFKDYQWDHIVASPLKRTMDTARLVTGLDEDSICQEERLMEQNFGIFEGKTYTQLCLEYKEQMDSWNQDFSHYRILGGESFADVRKRVEDWVSELPHGKGQMLVVAHKGTLGHMLAAMLGLPLEGYWNFVFEQGCYSCIDVEDGYAIIRKLNQNIG